MEDLHSSAESAGMAAAAIAPTEKTGQESQEDGQLQLQNNNRRLEAENEDDLDLLKLGYKSVLARGWGAFDNFACSFSALYCIGGIRVLFSIALSNGGPAAMYVNVHAILLL